MTQRHTTANPVTVERLEKAVHALAFIVLRHGEQYAELMEWVDEELTLRRQLPSARDRAQRILRERIKDVSHAPVA
ncbi:MAG: hypothetical protein ACOH2M_33640 [Cypionkella sp.]